MSKDFSSGFGSGSSVSEGRENLVEVSQPAVAIVWDPELMTEEEYADLVEAVGNLFRSHGGVGIKLLRQFAIELPVEEGVLQ